MKIKNLAILFFLTIISGLSLVCGQDDLSSAVPNKDVEQVVYSLMQDINKNDYKASLYYLSKEYHNSADMLKKMIGGNVNVEKRIIKDFNFYSVALPIDLQVQKSFAIVSFFITPNNNCDIEALRKRRTSKVIWAGGGGNIYGERFLVEGSKNIVTYYIVKQNGSWKLHNSYFSDSPLTPEQKNSVLKLMEKHMFYDKPTLDN